MPRITAEAIAPPTPCTKRAAISIAAVCAAPHSSEARVKTQPGEEDALAADQVAEPARQQQQAAERDQVGVDHPGQADREKPRSLWIVGSATFTIVWSRMIISIPAQSTTRASQRERADGVAVDHGSPPGS